MEGGLGAQLAGVSNTYGDGSSNTVTHHYDRGGIGKKKPVKKTLSKKKVK